MSHTIQSIKKAFRTANMVAPDDDMAAIMAESMRASGYPDDQLNVALAYQKPASQNTGTQPRVFGT